MEICHCPRDQQKLIESDSESHRGFVCGRCYGTWLPFGYIATVQNKRHFVPELFIHELRAATTRQTEMKCPSVCQGQLSEANAKDISLEWCPICNGVWFDNGELKKLLSAYPIKPQAENIALAADGLGTLLLILASAFK